MNTLRYMLLVLVSLLVACGMPQQGDPCRIGETIECP
jgi:hypothetical protein